MYLFISDNTTDTKGLRYQLREGDLKKTKQNKKTPSLEKLVFTNTRNNENSSKEHKGTTTRKIQHGYRSN